jgi:hypothetical protein
LEQDPGAVLLGGIIGSGSLLLAWAIVQLGQALTGLTKRLAEGITVTIVSPINEEKRKG